MFYLVWKDYDGYYSENFLHHITLAEKLIELLRKEKAEEYGTEVILVLEGSEVAYEYKTDTVNYDEKLYLYGDIIITNKLPNPAETIKIKCPMCGFLAEKKDIVSFPSEGEYYTLTRYKCPSCVSNFYL